MRARLRVLKFAPEIPALSLDKADISIVESEDDHLISEGMRAGLRAKLMAGRVFEMGNASHFPYVTRPENYNAMLAELLHLK
jgi:pimeloyl-ACP methyl ester carboxylesterase